MNHLWKYARLRPYGIFAVLRNLTALVFVLLGSLTVTAQERITVAVLGDSLTHGYGLPPEEGFVPQLQLWLDENDGRPVSLINAGVSGDTTAGGLARLDWTLTPEVDAIIVQLGGNDLLRALEPSHSRDNLDKLLARVSERGMPALLAGMAAPLNYGPAFKAQFDDIYPSLAEKYQAVLYPSFFKALQDAVGDGSPGKLMQSDGIHPSREGVALIVEDIGPFVRTLLDRIEG